jgi:hypothetical protein
MTLQDLFYVPLDWTGTTSSTFLFAGICVILNLLLYFFQCRTKENLRSGEMLVCGDQWPIFLYAHHVYDPEDPWCGLLRSHLLVYVSAHSFFRYLICYEVFRQAYKHVFTSPSSVEREPKATRSGNARLHGMNSVTIASLAYIATQVHWVSILWLKNFDVRLKVRFALSSSSVFSRTDTTTDLETFYHSLLDLLEDPGEYKEIDELLTWWNQYFFSLFAMPLRLIIVTHSAKFSPLPLRPRDPLVPTARYSKSDKNV